MSSLHRGYCTFAVPHVEGLVLKFFEISVDPFDLEKKYIILDKSLRKAVNFVSKNLYKSWGERMAQWWEHLLPTNGARTRTSASMPYVGWVCCWFSPLLEEIFLRLLRFPPLLKNLHFQFPIRSGTHGHVSASSQELLSVPWVNKLHYITTQPTISHQISYELSLRINFKARTYTIQCKVFLVPVSSARKFSWLFAFSFSGSSRWYGRWGCPWTKWLHGKSLFGIPDDNVLHWLGK